MNKKDIHNYEDIMNIPRHISLKHAPMSRIDRAAQFAPFAALTGHKEAINEMARETDKKKMLDENRLAILNNQLHKILQHIQKQPQIKLTYFLEDKQKEGGQYITEMKKVKKIDEYERILIFLDDHQVKIDDIYDIEIIS